MRNDDGPDLEETSASAPVAEIDLEKLYGAALKPERFDDLLQHWVAQISGANWRRFLGEFRAEGVDGGVDDHLKHALEVAEQSARIWRESAAHDDRFSIEHDPHPAFVLSPDGRIVELNDAARKVYGMDHPEHFEALPYDAATVSWVLAQCRGGVEKAAVQAERAGGAGFVTLLVHAADEQRFTVRTTELVWSQGLQGLLTDTFEFTGAEVQVTRLLVEGASVAQAAEVRSTSVATVRSQVRSILEKTHCNAISELIRLVVSAATLPELVTRADVRALENDAQSSRPLPSERALFTLPDRRAMEYAEFGDPDGRPVLYIHDSFFGIFWTDEAVKAITARGFRVIAPVRPSYGRSDPAPRRSDNLASCVADMRALLDELEVTQCLIVTRTMGLAYARELAYQQPDRVLGIVALAPALSFKAVQDVEAMPAPHRFQFLAARAMPRMLDFMGRVVASYFERRGGLAFYRWAFRTVPADLEVLEQSAAQACIEASSTFNTGHGHLGWLRDLLRTRGETSRPWLDSPVHVACYVGAEENNSRRQRAERLIAQGADLSLHIVEGAGELFFYTQPELLADAIEDGWSR